MAGKELPEVQDVARRTHKKRAKVASDAIAVGKELQEPVVAGHRPVALLMLSPMLTPFSPSAESCPPSQVEYSVERSRKQVMVRVGQKC